MKGSHAAVNQICYRTWLKVPVYLAPAHALQVAVQPGIYRNDAGHKRNMRGFFFQGAPERYFIIPLKEREASIRWSDKSNHGFHDR